MNYLVDSIFFRLTKGRMKARQKKMGQIARLLDIPTNLPTYPTQPNYALLGLRHERKQKFIFIRKFQENNQYQLH